VLVLSGVIRVQKMNPQGHEILLYRVEEGQSCILTTACMIGHKAYPAEGIVEHDVDLILISPENFNDTMAKSEVFREFVMANISLRICDLMLLLEDVAFGRMDCQVTRSQHLRKPWEIHSNLHPPKYRNRARNCTRCSGSVIV